jgi:hypothetical protein
MTVQVRRRGLLALASILLGYWTSWAQAPTLVVSGTGGTTHDFTGSYYGDHGGTPFTITAAQPSVPPADNFTITPSFGTSTAMISLHGYTSFGQTVFDNCPYSFCTWVYGAGATLNISLQGAAGTNYAIDITRTASMSTSTADSVGAYSASADSTSTNTQTGPPSASFSTVSTVRGTGSFSTTVSLGANVGFRQTFCVSDAEGCLGGTTYPGGGAANVDYTVNIVARMDNQPQPDTINVTTNLGAATFSITGPASYSGSGTSFSTANAPAGTYTATFGAVTRYLTPTPQTETLMAGGTISFNGTYTPVNNPGSGTINVTTNLSTSMFSITGPASYNGSGTSFSTANAPAGTYTATFGPVAGYVTPLQQTQTLAAGETISFAGGYIKMLSLGLCEDSSCQTAAFPPKLTVLPSRFPRPIVGCALITYQPQTLNFSVGCFDLQTGLSIPNCNASLSLAPVADSGGHAHDDPTRPAGSLSLTSGSTGSSGLLVTYTAPEVSGQVTLSLSGSQSDGTPIPASTMTIDVGVNGLEALALSSNYNLTGGGSTFPHPDNHFALPYINLALAAIAKDFEAQNNGAKLSYNDMSLVEGGIFDLYQNWAPPHCGHLSLGKSAISSTNNVDIRIPPTATMQKKLKDIIKNHGGWVCFNHPNHFHVCF